MIDSRPNLSQLRSTRQFDLVICSFLAISTLLVFFAALKCEFVDFYDRQYVTRNPAIAGGISSAGIIYAWTAIDFPGWMPLTYLSWVLDAALFGVNPTGFHATNLFLHIGNVCLVYLLFRRSTNSILASVMTAILFAFHPLHVEPVVWISDRREVLGTFVLLLTLLAYSRYRHSPSLQQLASVTGIVAVAPLANPNLIVIPLLLFLFDHWPLGETSNDPKADVNSLLKNGDRHLVSQQSIVDDQTATEPVSVFQQAVKTPLKSGSRSFSSFDRIPLLLPSIILAIIVFIVRRETPTVETSSLPLSSRIGYAIQVYGFALGKTVWPTDLSVYYPWKPLSVLAISFTLTALLIVTAYVLLYGRARKHLVFGWLWFLIALFPAAIGPLPTGRIFADGFTYVPHIGLLSALIWEIEYGLSSLLKKADCYLAPQQRIDNYQIQTEPVPVSRQAVKRFTSQQWVVYVVAVPIIVTGIALTLVQIPVWTTSETLWTNALKLDSDNDGAHEHLGLLALSRKNLDEAILHFHRVVELRPESASSIYQLGRVYEQNQEWDQAEECFAWALRINRDFPEAIRALSHIKQQQRLSPQIKTVRHRPSDEAIASHRLGMEHARRNEFEAALQHFQKAAAIDPQFADALSNAGLTLVRLKLPDEARKKFLLALEIDPDNADFHVNLAILLESEQEPDDARKHYEAALQLKPQDVEARQRLNRLMKQLTDRDRH